MKESSRPTDTLRLLVVDDLVPNPQFGYGYPRSFNILRHLAKSGISVTFYPLQSSRRNEPAATVLETFGLEIARGQTEASGNFDSFLTERIEQFDAIWVSRLKNLKTVLWAREKTSATKLLIYDAEALNAPREIQRLRLEGNLIPNHIETRMQTDEIDLMRAADVVVSVSQQEAAVLRDAGIAPVFVLGHAIDVAVDIPPFEHRRDILFFGGFYGPTPNKDAVLYFLREIFPLIRKRIDAQFFVAGYRSQEEFRHLMDFLPDNVSIMGTIDCARDLFDKVRVFVVPTRWAAGIPYKLHEAFAHGLPSVVTPLIADQIGREDDAVLIGNSPAAFAEQVCALYNDPGLWNTLQLRGLAKASRECSVKASSNTMESIISCVADKIVVHSK
ncbi:MAG: glycosyltransferase family 4 protein [Xanthobacteraceae bacterium]